MTGRREQVTQMAADAEAGRSPALLEAYLHATFPPRQPWAWLRSMVSGPVTHRVHAVRPFPDGGFFTTSCLFWVYSDVGLLESHVLPSGGSFGLFALGPGGVRYLVHHAESLEAVLREEGRPLETCSPSVLASLVTETVGLEGNSSHDIVGNVAHLQDYRGEGERGGDGWDGYRLDYGELDRVLSEIVEPAISGDAGAGWQLDFCSVFGWMHDKHTLLRHRVRFDPDFRMTHDETVLSKWIFHAVPQLRY